MKKKEVIKGFKGFNQDLKCRDFQYEIGNEYETDNAKCCETGFHFCENPLDVLNYYPLKNGNRFTEVEGYGIIDKHNEDTKVSVSKIKIGLELDLKSLINSAVKFIFEKTTVSENTQSTSGDNANSATSGDNANSATSGNNANSATSGYNANSATSGNNANSDRKSTRLNSSHH
jgi:hypothetical protein